MVKPAVENFQLWISESKHYGLTHRGDNYISLPRELEERYSHYPVLVVAEVIAKVGWVDRALVISV